MAKWAISGLRKCSLPERKCLQLGDIPFSMGSLLGILVVSPPCKSKRNSIFYGNASLYILWNHALFFYVQCRPLSSELVELRSHHRKPNRGLVSPERSLFIRRIVCPLSLHTSQLNGSSTAPYSSLSCSITQSCVL